MKWLSRSRPSAHQMHMTFARNSLSRSLTRTGVFLRQQIWIFPILAVICLTILGYFVQSSIEQTMKANLKSELQTLLTVESQMLQIWMKVQESTAQGEANDRKIRETIYGLMSAAESTTQPIVPLASLPNHAQLAKELSPTMSAHHYTGYILADKSKRVISSSIPTLIGITNNPEYDSMLAPVFEGKTIITAPFASMVMIDDEQGVLRSGVPTMFVIAPVRDAEFQIVAALGLRISPWRDFTRLMQLGQIGNTGETYAFNRDGMMVSNSRFDESLILLGLLPDLPASKSMLSLGLRDPGGNLVTGYRPGVRRSELPLTYMAALATQGQSGVNVDGYRDYRGVPVIGAWRWLPEYEIGIATELDSEEAFRPLVILHRTFLGLFLLLAIAAIAIFVFTIIVARMRREAQKTAIASKKLGQYTLEKKLGAGGMGVVYKGYHAILRRPTALKMLNLDLVNSESIARFEREVQMTCQLNHPSTVAIYDFGRTEENVFYYAMEYLDGIDLQKLVERYGPQSEARVVRILTQVCGSLFEAHSQGLVHRDIKPANIMLNRRGGEPDVAKVLDFGLVKTVDDAKQASQNQGNSLTGTPLYMSPEAIQSPNLVDARSDLYAVGAVGYYLLTGRPVFDAHSIVELCQMHVVAIPDTPSQRLGRPVNPDLESALLCCLEKNRARRPQTARDLALLLARCQLSTPWSIEEADAWWNRHEREAAVAGAAMDAAIAQSSASQVQSALPQKSTARFDQTYVGGPED